MNEIRQCSSLAKSLCPWQIDSWDLVSRARPIAYIAMTSHVMPNDLPVGGFQKIEISIDIETGE